MTQGSPVHRGFSKASDSRRYRLASRQSAATTAARLFEHERGSRAVPTRVGVGHDLASKGPGTIASCTPVRDGQDV